MQFINQLGIYDTSLNGISSFIGDEFTPSAEVLGRLANVFADDPTPTKTQLYLASKIKWDSLGR